MGAVEVILTLVCIGQTVTTVAVLRSASAEKRALLNGIMAKDGAEAQRFAMMEKIAARPKRVKAAKPDPVIPFGL